jgi:hypothetical protein
MMTLRRMEDTVQGNTTTILSHSRDQDNKWASSIRIVEVQFRSPSVVRERMVLSTFCYKLLGPL